MSTQKPAPARNAARKDAARNAAPPVPAVPANVVHNTYEALIILKPILDVDNSDNVLKSVEETVESLKGRVLKKDKLGRKRLAYEIGKFKDGFVTVYLFSLDPASVAAFRRSCQLNEDILRMVIINRSDVDMNDATIYGRERPGDRGDRSDRGDRGGDRPERGDREFRPRERAGFRTSSSN